MFLEDISDTPAVDSGVKQMGRGSLVADAHPMKSVKSTLWHIAHNTDFVRCISNCTI